MLAKALFTLSAAIAIAAAAPALAEEPGRLAPGHDDVSSGDAPSAASWQATDRAAGQDDSRMQPPKATPGTESRTGTKGGVEVDVTTMRPVGQ